MPPTQPSRLRRIAAQDIHDLLAHETAQQIEPLHFRRRQNFINDAYGRGSYGVTFVLHLILVRRSVGGGARRARRCVDPVATTLKRVRGGRDSLA